MQEFFITSDGIKLHAKLDRPQDVDRCPLCIVFHGLTGHMEERHIVAVSQAMNEVGVATLRVELYGHGQSEGDFAKHTLLKWINNGLDVIEYARGLDFVTRLYLCGHSQGGLLTMLLAGIRPDDLDAIIPMSPACVITDAAREGVFFGMRFDPLHVPDRFVFGPNTFCGDYFRVAQLIHVEEAIDRYPGPALLVHGTADPGVPYQDSVEASRRYADARLVTLPDDNHGYDLHLAMVTEAIKAFLQEMAS